MNRRSTIMQDSRETRRGQKGQVHGYRDRKAHLEGSVFNASKALNKGSCGEVEES